MECCRNFALKSETASDMIVHIFTKGVIFVSVHSSRDQPLSPTMHRNYGSGYGHHGPHGHQPHHHGGSHGMGMNMGMGIGMGMGMQGMGMGMGNMQGMGGHQGMGGAAAMNSFLSKYPAVSNYTNDMSPAAKAARVFVGNLNTYTRKEDRKNIMELLMETFMKYGRIRAISIHSGFGFVQFETSEQAKNAMRGEQGKLIKNQPLGESIYTVM